MSNLVELGYFTSESFFQFVPTIDGLKRPAPSSTYTFKKIDICTQEEKNYTIDKTEYPLNTVYEYLNNYYCLKYMDLKTIANRDGPLATKVILGELPEKPYSYIKQLTIYDSPNTLYYIASLGENNQIIRQQYRIGLNGFLQFYDNKIFGVYPSAVLLEYQSVGETFLKDYAITAPSNNVSSLSRIEMIITTSNFEDSSFILPSPKLDLTIFSKQEEPATPATTEISAVGIAYQYGGSTLITDTIAGTARYYNYGEDD